VKRSPAQNPWRPAGERLGWLALVDALFLITNLNFAAGLGLAGQSWLASRRGPVSGIRPLHRWAAWVGFPLGYLLLVQAVGGRWLAVERFGPALGVLMLLAAAAGTWAALARPGGRSGHVSAGQAFAGRGGSSATLLWLVAGLNTALPAAVVALAPFAAAAPGRLALFWVLNPVAARCGRLLASRVSLEGRVWPTVSFAGAGAAAVAMVAADHLACRLAAFFAFMCLILVQEAWTLRLLVQADPRWRERAAGLRPVAIWGMPVLGGIADLVGVLPLMTALAVVASGAGLAAVLRGRG